MAEVKTELKGAADADVVKADAKQAAIDAARVEAEAKKQAEFEKAKAEDDSKVTAEQQAKLDKLFQDEDNEPAEIPTEDAIESAKETCRKIAKLVRSTDAAADSHKVWGHIDVVLTLGDLRALARTFPPEVFSE